MYYALLRLKVSLLWNGDVVLFFWSRFFVVDFLVQCPFLAFIQ